jgi:hypothetical protein
MSESTSIECPLRRKEERSPASSFEKVPDPIVVPSRSKVRDREGRRSFQAHFAPTICTLSRIVHLDREGERKAMN